MSSSFAFGYGFWLEAVIVFGLGTAGIVCLAACTTRLVKIAAWQQTVWRVATLAIAMLLLAELTGAGTGLAWLVRSSGTTAEISSPKAPLRSSVETNKPWSRFILPETAAQTPSDLESVRLRGTEATGSVDVPRRDPPIVHDLSESPLGLSVSDSFSPSWYGPDRLPGIVQHEWRLDTIEDVDNVRRFASSLVLDERGPACARWDPSWPNGLPLLPGNPVLLGNPVAPEGVERQRPSASTCRFEPSPSNGPEFQEALSNGGGVTSSARMVSATKPSVGTMQFAKWPGIIWLFGTAFLATYVAVTRLLAWLYFARCARGVRDESVHTCIDTLGRQLRFRRRVRIVEATGLAAPVAFGIMRPTIALPTTFANDFEPRQQRVILAHELAHLAARDPLWRLVADLVSASLWWHPGVWWTRRCLHATSEAVADEASLLVPQGPDALAECLVSLGRHLTRSSAGRLGWLSVEGSGFRSGLGRRIQRLLNLPDRSWQAPACVPSWFAMTLLPAILVMAAVFSTAWGRPQVSQVHGETTMHVFHNSWRRSLAAATLVPLLSVFSGDGMTQEPRREVQKPAVRDDDSPKTDRPERERAKRERARPERRRDRERPELRERIEQRRRDAAERREAREPRGERRVVEQPVMERRQRELMQERRELEERAGDIEREIKRLRPEQDGEARELHEALREVHERMERIEREVHGRGRPDAEPHRPPPPRERELMQERRELEERARDIEREIERLRPEQDGEARELHEALREVHEGMERIEREVRGPGRPDAEPHRPPPPRERELMRERRELEERARDIEREIERRGPGEGDEVRELHEARREVHEQMERIEREARDLNRGRELMSRRREQETLRKHLGELEEALHRTRRAGNGEEAEHIQAAMAEAAERLAQLERSAGPPPRPHGPLEEMEGQVRELRGQVKEMRREMAEMRRLLQRIAERDRD